VPTSTAIVRTASISTRIVRVPSGFSMISTLRSMTTGTSGGVGISAATACPPMVSDRSTVALAAVSWTSTDPPAGISTSPSAACATGSPSVTSADGGATSTTMHSVSAS
jgi:hypothetical protein